MADGAQVLQKLQFETIICCNCNMPFAVPADTRWRWQTSGGTFYCPAGHPQSYTKTENTKLKEEANRLSKLLDTERKKVEWAQTHNRHLEASLRSEKGAKTKLKKRIANGVCPCCHRSFLNIKRHMETQHKDYSK